MRLENLVDCFVKGLANRRQAARQNDDIKEVLGLAVVLHKRSRVCLELIPKEAGRMISLAVLIHSNTRKNHLLQNQFRQILIGVGCLGYSHVELVPRRVMIALSVWKTVLDFISYRSFIATFLPGFAGLAEKSSVLEGRRVPSIQKNAQRKLTLPAR